MVITYSRSDSLENTQDKLKKDTTKTKHNQEKAKQN